MVTGEGVCVRLGLTADSQAALMDLCGPQATENRAGPSRAGARGSRVPGPWGCGGGAGAALATPLTGSSVVGDLCAGATLRFMWG